MNILLLGGIASGKTHLSDQLFSRLVSSRLISEKPGDNPYFERFLKDKHDCLNTTNMQRWFLSYFNKNFSNPSDGYKPRHTILDTFPPISGSLYAMVQYMTNLLDLESYHQLLKEYELAQDTFLSDGHKIDMVVLIHTETVSNMRRLFERNVEEFKFYTSMPYYLDLINSLNVSSLSDNAILKNSKVLHVHNPYNDSLAGQIVTLVDEMSDRLP